MVNVSNYFGNMLMNFRVNFVGVLIHYFGLISISDWVIFVVITYLHIIGRNNVEKEIEDILFVEVDWCNVKKPLNLFNYVCYLVN